MWSSTIELFYSSNLSLEQAQAQKYKKTNIFILCLYILRAIVFQLNAVDMFSANDTFLRKMPALVN
jgi:hypothetical protein